MSGNWVESSLQWCYVVATTTITKTTTATNTETTISTTITETTIGTAPLGTIDPMVFLVGVGVVVIVVFVIAIFLKMQDSRFRM